MLMKYFCLDQMIAYTHTHMCTHTDTHIHIHTCAHTCMHTSMHTCTHARMHARTHTHTQTHKHMPTYSCVHSHICLHAHACTYTHMHTHARTHACMHACTHTHTLTLSSCLIIVTKRHVTLEPFMLFIAHTVMFAGAVCQDAFDQCSIGSNPCNPYGTDRCVDYYRGYSCVCLPGYYGVNCTVCCTLSSSLVSFLWVI